MTDSRTMQAGREVVACLEALEQVFGLKYKLTFIARCIDADITDADVVVTSDSLEAVRDDGHHAHRLGDRGGGCGVVATRVPIALRLTFF